MPIQVKIHCQTSAYKVTASSQRRRGGREGGGGRERERERERERAKSKLRGTVIRGDS